MTQQQQQQQQQDLSFLSWRDDWFLSLWPLNASTVMDYFCRPINPFYDKTCLNETVKMQRLDPRVMSEMDGVEYMLHSHREPHLYVILKVHRSSSIGIGDRVQRKEAVFYINGGTVYQAPGLFEVIQARMYNCLSVLTKTYHEIEGSVVYSPSMGRHEWKFALDDADAEDAVDDNNNTMNSGGGGGDYDGRERDGSYRYLSLQHIPPYPADMQLHVDFLLYNLELETRELVDQKHKQAEDDMLAKSGTGTPPMQASSTDPISMNNGASASDKQQLKRPRSDDSHPSSSGTSSPIQLQQQQREPPAKKIKTS